MNMAASIPLGKDAAIRKSAKMATRRGWRWLMPALSSWRLTPTASASESIRDQLAFASAARETELSLFKHFLWQGKSLWGMMAHDDLTALAYLRSRARGGC